MKKHPYFDLLLHTDQELETILDGRVIERTTLHEWPLSCVERLRLENGSSWIYKSETEPTVEPEFYTLAQSPILVKTRTLYRDNKLANLILEDIDGIRLTEKSLDFDTAYEIGRKILLDIADIDGDPPVYLDISDWSLWQTIVEGMVEDLTELVRSERFKQVNHQTIRDIYHIAMDTEVKDIFNSLSLNKPSLVHHDLSAENVFACNNGYKVIDWQRPIRGPSGIDLVLFLSSLGFDPRETLPSGIIKVAELLKIHWFTECSVCWFPPGINTYDHTIAHIAKPYRE